MPRIKFLKGVISAALAIIVVRLFVIQIVEHDKWLAKAAEQHTILETIVAERGDIYMMDAGEPVKVVMNQTVYSIIIDPLKVDREAIKRVLEECAKDNLTIDLDELFENEELRYYVVAKNLSREVANRIASESIDYVWFQENTKRVYPEGEMASGLLGFVNADGIGQYGVEGALNERLAGTDGLLKTVADVNKVALSIGNDNVRVPAVDGEDIMLSIDRGMQRKTEEILAEAVENSVATNAAAIIMDPGTGEILTMANVPTYDPSNYGNVKSAENYINWTVEVPYEPASVCKTFTFATAINEGVMSAESTYNNTGMLTIDGWPIKNAEQRSSLLGTQTIQTAFNWSLNTGSIQALMWLGGDAGQINQTGREKLYDYFYNKFRFGQETGVELYEATGYVEDPNEGWGRDSTYANMTFGQNMQITMLQTATAFAAVVNGGKYQTPTILRNSDRAEGEQIVSEATSEAMRAMLYGTRTSKRKTGVDKAGYYIGGKTGTAQVVKNGSYDDAEGETIASYIGFGGTEGELPKYVIMVKIWGEGQHMDGTKDALPVFDELSNTVIDYLKIKPKV